MTKIATALVEEIGLASAVDLEIGMMIVAIVAGVETGIIGQGEMIRAIETGDVQTILLIRSTSLEGLTAEIAAHLDARDLVLKRYVTLTATSAMIRSMLITVDSHRSLQLLPQLRPPPLRPTSKKRPRD